MELTIDQALQQGVAAHKEGRLQDAERLYRAILQAQPNHPDANHNLGVLAVAVGKPLEALPLFQRALDGNPQIEQFWLSYIDALIKLERFDEAKRVSVEGEQAGLSSDKLDVLKPRLKSTVPSDTNKAAKGQTLSKKIKKLTEKEKSKRRKARSSSTRAEPSQVQRDLLLEHYQAGRLEEAEELATLLTQQFPRHAFGWKALGVVFRQMGKLNESLLPMQESVDLSPQDAEAHYNFGVTLEELGRLDDAEASYTKAIALKPDFAETHYNLGNTLKKLGRLDEAEASYREAIALKPDFAEAQSNLGNTLRELGRLGESISACVRAINLKADSDNTYFNLGLALSRTRFNAGDQSLYPILINLLTRKNFVRPIDVAGAILSLLRLDNRIEDVLLSTAVMTDIKEVDRAIKTLAQLQLLHQLMRICPLPDLQLEALFVSMRRVILAGRRQMAASPEFIHFLSTLSLHCFTNEYVYYETEEEGEQISVLGTKIAESIAQGSQPTVTEALILATYRPIHQYDWSEKLKILDHLPEVRVRLLEEPLAERVIVRDMAVLAEIEDSVSRKVREQYEESPYPRWVKLVVPQKAKTVAKVCDEGNLQLQCENIKSVSNPTILVAGCGTGQHSIETASRFANCQVTAIDLSRASLAYAQRKTRELGITNIQYLQADILNLAELDREFDIIESSGVLHHMDDPMAGWRVLVSLLRTGGLMNIGLYSDLARHHIARIREDIAQEGMRASEAEIRQFRQTLAQSHDEHHQKLLRSGDFFSLSAFRDLIFHVQEHRFTIPKIQRSLDQLGLKFCGFENPEIVARFKEAFGNESDTCDLSLWHQFEESHPRAFAGMYQIWCQKI